MLYRLQILKKKLRSGLGELWWYTLVFFFFQRFGDMVNAFIGLWLVPQYVPHEELGAVLPLLQVGGVFAFPIAVLALTFSKFMSAFATRGEFGKVKRLLRDVFCFSVILCMATMACAHFFLPFILERMRVANGRLGLLVVFSGIICVIATFFSNALHSLKLFRWSSIIGFLSAPVRLITLLICLPIRALSGYFVGQIASVVFSMAASLFVLRRFLFTSQIKAEPYFQSDGRDILRFTFFIFMGGLLTMPQGIIEPFVIRHRLPDIESAAYYMISRFAEIGSFVGLSMSVILFPLASEQHEKGSKSQRLVLHAISGSLLAGILLAGVFYLLGGYLFRWLPNGVSYLPYIPHLSALTVILTMRSASTVYIANENAHQRYGVYGWSGLLVAVEAIFLYCITGFSFFAAWVPPAWTTWVLELKPARLDFVLWVMFIYSLIWMFCMITQLAFHRHQRNSRQL